MLDAAARIAAFGVHHPPIQTLLLRWYIKSVDILSRSAPCAADEDGRRSRVVLGDSSSSSGRVLVSLRKTEARQGGGGGGGRGQSLACR